MNDVDKILKYTLDDDNNNNNQNKYIENNEIPVTINEDNVSEKSNINKNLSNFNISVGISKQKKLFRNA